MGRDSTTSNGAAAKLSRADFQYHLLSIGVNRVPRRGSGRSDIAEAANGNGASVRAAERDAFGVSWAFAQLGYWRAERNRCVAGAQATPEAIRAHLDFVADLEGLDLLLVYWSGYVFDVDHLVAAVAASAGTRQRVLIIDTCDAANLLGQIETALDGVPDGQRPVAVVSCPADGCARENSVHGLFTGAFLRQLRRPRRPGTKTLDLLDAFNRAADESVSRVGQPPLFSANGSGRLRIPILAQLRLEFEQCSPGL
jgi:hypothetical protein